MVISNVTLRVVFDSSLHAPLISALVSELSRHGLSDTYRHGCNTLHKLIATDDKAEELLLAHPTLVQAFPTLVNWAPADDACKKAGDELLSRFTETVKLRVAYQHIEDPQRRLQASESKVQAQAAELAAINGAAAIDARAVKVKREPGAE